MHVAIVHPPRLVEFSSGKQILVYSALNIVRIPGPLGLVSSARQPNIRLNFFCQPPLLFPGSGFFFF
jgi:hypothetical protein